MQLDSGTPAGSPHLSPLLLHVLATLSPPPHGLPPQWIRGGGWEGMGHGPWSWKGREGRNLINKIPAQYSAGSSSGPILVVRRIGTVIEQVWISSTPEAMRGHGTGTDSTSSDVESRGQCSRGKGDCYQKNREGMLNSQKWQMALEIMITTIAFRVCHASTLHTLSH